MLATYYLTLHIIEAIAISPSGKEQPGGLFRHSGAHASATTLIHGTRVAQAGVFVAAWNLDRHCLTQTAAGTLSVLRTEYTWMRLLSTYLPT